MKFSAIFAAAVSSVSKWLVRAPPFPFLWPARSKPGTGKRVPRGSVQPNCRAELRDRVKRGSVAFIYPRGKAA